MKKILQKRLQFCNLFAIITYVIITICNFFKGVAFIFKDLDISALLNKFTENKLVCKVGKVVKSNKTAVKIVSYFMIGLLAVLISVLSVGIRVGFNVNYSGKVIATVSDTSVFDNAKDIAVKNLANNRAGKAIAKPEFVLTLTVSNQLSTPANLAEKIIENTNEIVDGSALVVNGETVVCTESCGLEKLINDRKTAFFVNGADNTSEFVDKVEVKNGYYLEEDIEELEKAEEIISELDVKTVSTVVSENTVTYSVKKLKTSSYKSGYHRVYKKGKNGLTRTTVVSETINGAKSCENKISSVIVSEPTEQVEIIGTASSVISSTQRAEATSKGFICPLNRGTFTVSAYFGDGRNHKAIDLAADRGTPIFAVQGGVVTYASYDGDYGYNVVIDHGNGIKTRYAHASALCVSVGAKVTQGQMIAAVGSTGYSTGNHLHFEVIASGIRVNPAPYIGL